MSAATFFAGQVSTSYNSWDPLPSKQVFLHSNRWSAAPTSRPRLCKLRLAAAPAACVSERKVTKRQSLGYQNETAEMTTLLGNVSNNVRKLIMDTLKVLQKPAVALLLVSLLMSSPNDALAASGGRMGGRSFSSGVPRSGQTYSMPRSGVYAYSFSVPYAAPSPFFGGGLYVTPAYSVGFGGGGVVLMLLLGFVAFQLVSGFLVDRGEGTLAGTTKTSVLKLQVGLLGMARSLQRELEQLANRADTSSPEGLHYLLTETVLSLMRHPDFCISGTSSSEVKRSIEAGESRFNQLSLEERGKFDEETLVSVNNIRKRSVRRAYSNSFNNEYIVVTILLAVQGEYKLPVINSNADLRAALSKLGSVPADQVLAVEVLWTPQDESDSLSEKELLRDYPLLRPL